MLILLATVSAQTVNVTFTGRMSETNEVVPLTFVTIQNLSRGWIETLRYPDTILVMTDVTGVQEWQHTNAITLYQNTPNPFSDATEVQLSVAVPGYVTIEISDIFGRVIVAENRFLSQAGVHLLRANLPAAGTYLMTVRQDNQSASIKMVCSGGNGKSIDYVGTVHQLEFPWMEKGWNKAGSQHPYLPGDVILCQGFSLNESDQLMRSDPIQQEIDHVSQDIPLLFSTSSTTTYQSCPGMPIAVDHQGNIYTTVLMGNQCWTRENMRCTTSPNGCLQVGCTPADYSQPFWYYDFSNADIPLIDCGIYYTWAGAMDTTSDALIGTSFTGRRGICPQGWHVPSYDELDTLCNYLSSQNDFLCDIDSSSYIAKALASENYWNTDTTVCSVGNDPSANNATGFSMVPAGFYDHVLNAIVYTGDDACFWSSTSLMNSGYSAYVLGIHHNWARPSRGASGKNFGNSVRCIRD